MVDPFPKHSDEAQKNMWIHYTDYQDVDIYIEDETKEALYNDLVKRMKVFEDECRFFKVFPIRGKKKVLDLSREMDNYRKRFFIVDGDFDFISEENDLDNRVFMHPCYCLENYFFCEKAIRAIVKEELAGKISEKEEAAIQKIVSNEKEKELLVQLFHTYAAIKCTCGVPTISNARKVLLKNGNQVEIAQEKVLHEVHRLEVEAIEKVGEDVFYNAKTKIASSIEELPDKLSIVSGKDGLMPILLIKLNTICQTKFKTDSLVYRLSKHFDLGRIEPLRKFLMAQI